MKKLISISQAQEIAKAVASDAHIYARAHEKEFDEFLKMKENSPPKAVYIDEDFDLKGG